MPKLFIHKSMSYWPEREHEKLNRLAARSALPAMRLSRHVPQIFSVQDGHAVHLREPTPGGKVSVPCSLSLCVAVGTGTGGGRPAYLTMARSVHPTGDRGRAPRKPRAGSNPSATLPLFRHRRVVSSGNSTKLNGHVPARPARSVDRGWVRRFRRPECD